MENYTKDQRMSFYTQRKLDKNNAWLMFLLLGWSYGSLNQMGKQIIFYLTLGGLGLWVFYVLFTLNKKIATYNSNLATKLGLTEDDKLMLGL